MPYYFKEIPGEFASQKLFQMYKYWGFTRADMRKSIKLHDADHTQVTQSVPSYVIPPQQWIRDEDGRILSFNYNLLNGDKYFPVSESKNYNYVVSGSVYNTNLFTGYFDENLVQIVQKSGAIQVRYNGVTTLYTQSQNIFITGSTLKKSMWYSIWNMFYRIYDPTGSLGPYAPEFGYQVVNSSSANATYVNEFTTGSLGNKALIFDIPKRYYGEEIKKKSFNFSGTTVLAPSRLWTPEILGNRVKIWLRADNIQTSSGAPIPVWSASDSYNNNGIPVTAYFPPVYLSNPYGYTAGNERPAVAFSENVGVAQSKALRVLDNPSWMTTTASLFIAMYSYGVIPDGAMLGNRFGATDLGYGGFHLFHNAAMPYTVINGVWNYPNLGITSGRLSITYRCSKRTHQGAWQDKDFVSPSTPTPEATIAYSHVGSPGYDLLIGAKTNTYGYGGWHQSLNAAISEIIYISDELTDDEFQKMQGYLAWKWGDNTYRTLYGLAPNHPYYSAPPYFTDSEYASISPPYALIDINDDSYGNLFDAKNPSILTQSYGTSSVKLPLGNISYDKGLVIVTNENYRYVSSASMIDTATQTFIRSTIPDYNSAGIQLRFAFTSSYTAYENEYICIAKANEFNWTDNRSAYSTDGIWKFADLSGSFGKFTFRPFVTGIGLYDDANILVAYAKMNMPVRMEKDLDTVFIVNFDT